MGCTGAGPSTGTSAGDPGGPGDAGGSGPTENMLSRYDITSSGRNG